MFKFYLDNNLVSDPINWDDFTETIERDSVIKGILPKYEVKLNFNAGGYKYLFDQYSANGFCKLVELKVDYKCNEGAPYSTILNGYIFLSDCKFNLNKCTVSCDVQDNNFGARIYNNKNLTAKLNVGYSKNADSNLPFNITPASEINLPIFDTSNSLIGSRKVFEVKDAFRFLIDYMSDGLIGFESDFLTPAVLSQTAGWMYISSGQEMRLNDGSAPIISFQTLFEEVNKKYPISFTIIKDSTGKSIIKIENDDYFYNLSNSIQINNIQDLQQSFDNELLYSKIKFGGTVADYDPALGEFPIIRFLGFTNEEYNFQGECNIDKTLDLTATFIADSNVIQRITATDTTNSQYDANVIFIESIYGIGSELTNSLVTNGIPYYYNANLTNNKIAERYSLANNLAFYLGDNSDTFNAFNTGTQIIVNFPDTTAAEVFTDVNYYYTPPIRFNNDSSTVNCNVGFDTNGNYNNTLFRFVSPADGSYGFEAFVDFFVDINAPGNKAFAQLQFNVYDTGNILVYAYPFDMFETFSNAFFGKFTASKTINVPSGFYVTVVMAFHSAFDSNPDDAVHKLYIFGSNTRCPGSYFKTTSVNSGGGIYETKDIQDYRVSKLEYDYPVSENTYNAMKQDLTKSLIVNHDGQQNKRAWIRKVVRKLSTGETKFELISNITNTH